MKDFIVFQSAYRKNFSPFEVAKIFIQRHAELLLLYKKFRNFNRVKFFKIVILKYYQILRMPVVTITLRCFGRW